jgi:sulfonate transport system ATP-binding protein
MIAPAQLDVKARQETFYPEEPEAAVYVRGLRKTFGSRLIFDGIDLDIRKGQFVALLGPSGTGKTTLLRILSGLEEADEGVVLVPKVRTTVYQEPRLVPSMRVLSNVTIGQAQTADSRAAAMRALTQVGLGDRARSWPGVLSGGEAQRVALARALVRKPDLLLLDEPFASLDALTRLQMQDLVVTLLGAHQPATLLVTHDVDEAILLADRVLVLQDGHLSFDLEIYAPRDRDREDPHFLAYRRALLANLGVSAHPRRK